MQRMIFCICSPSHLNTTLNMFLLYLLNKYLLLLLKIFFEVKWCSTAHLSQNELAKLKIDEISEEVIF